jgi:hypothetical protein
MANRSSRSPFPAPFRTVPILLALALSACVGGSPERTSEAPPSTARPSAGHAAVLRPTQTTQACYADLNAAGIRYTPLPDQDFGGGCNARGAVRLSDIGTPITNTGAITCPLARNFAAWVRNAVKPAARQIYRQEIVRVETFGTYSCRNIYGGRSGRLSQHAFANAIDVSAFVLADGQRITLLQGWHGDSRSQQFLRLIHTSACRRFPTVLSPDYNAAHANHFHLDMSGQNFCR